MANLFKTAKQSGAKPSTKKEKLEVVVKDSDFHESLHRMAELNEEIDTLQSEYKVLAEEVKETAIEEFVKVYNQTKVYPGSFKIVATGAKKLPNSSLLLVPTDKYSVIDEDRYKDLKKKFGPSIVTEEDTYIMDTAMVEKYGEVISALILNSKDIEEEDKEKLIKVVTKYSVKKGTISSLHTFKQSMSILLENVSPIFQMKNIEKG